MDCAQQAAFPERRRWAGTEVVPLRPFPRTPQIPQDVDDTGSLGRIKAEPNALFAVAVTTLTFCMVKLASW